MKTLITEAHEKLLLEMSDNSNPTIDKLHNYLSDNMDEKVAQGIKDGKTLGDALKAITSNARKLSVGGSAAVDSDIVFGWLVDYYTDKKTVVSPVKKEVKTKKVKKKPEVKKEELQIGFEF